MGDIFFVSGIDTNVGKSYCTAYIAKQWNDAGRRTITQKFIQTGNVGRSEDIELHRRVMGWDFTDEDRAGWTMPEIFTYPASPDLASRIDHRAIDYTHIGACTRRLAERYDTVLIEGAGGLMVPLEKHRTTIDYIREMDYAVMLVTSARLGSVNHTLLSVEALQHRGIRLRALVYNHFPEEKPEIAADTHDLLRNLAAETEGCEWIEVPRINL